MQSSPPKSDKLKNIALMGAVLTGCFVAITMLIITNIIVPKLFRPQPLHTVFWFLGLGMVIAIYNIFAYRLHFSFLVHLLFLMLIQWLNLRGRIWVVTKTFSLCFFNLLTEVKNHWQWMLSFTVLWLIVNCFSHVLNQISRIPQKIVINDRMDKWRQEAKVNLISWEQSWLKWRILVTLFMTVTVVILAIGFSNLRTRQGMSWSTGLFYIQLLLGLILIIVGFFFYKRAFWKLDDLEPDSRFKKNWYREITLSITGVTILGLIIPANFKALNNWWIVSFLDQVFKDISLPKNIFPASLPEAEEMIFSNLKHYTESLNLSTNLTSIFYICLFFAFLLLLLINRRLIVNKLSKSFTGEIEKLKIIPGVLKKFYLFWYNLWRRWWSRPIFKSIREQDGFEDSANALNKVIKNKIYFRKQSPREIIRRGFCRLVRVARFHGLYWRPTQTPQDIASELTKLLPDDGEAVNKLIADYQQARYSLNEPSSEKARLFERLRRMVEKRLRFILFLTFILISAQFRICAAGLTNDNILESQQAVELALMSDLSLQVAKLNLEIAKKDYQSAKRFLSIGGSYSLIDTDPGDWRTLTKTFGTNSGGTYDTTMDHIYSKWYLEYNSVDQDNYSYHLSYSPFDLGHEKHIKTMELNYINQDLNYQNTRNKLIMDVRNAYAEVVLKEEFYKLAVHDMELFSNQFKLAANLYDSRKISHFEFRDAEQQLKTAEVKLYSAELNRQASLLKLSVLLGRDNLTGVSLERSTLDETTPARVDLEATIEQYLKNSLEVKAVEIKIRVEKVQKLMDSFYLFKNIYIYTGETRNNGEDATYYGIGFKGSLDDSYFRDYRASKKKLEAVQLNKEIVIRNKRTQIMEAYRNWEISALNLNPMRQIVAIAKERLNIAGQKYEKGMASVSELNQCYLSLNKAEEGYWNAWLNRQYARELFYQSVNGEPVLKDEQFQNNLALRGDG